MSEDTKAGWVAIDPLDALWDDDKVQFARLLCELVANNENLNLEEVAGEMDLSVSDVAEILERAVGVWEGAKRGESIYIHIHEAPPQLSDLQSPENPMQEHWEILAKEWYRAYYNIYEKSQEELRNLELRRDWLWQFCPETYNEGVHLLHEGGGWMGEDVYIVDREMTHAIHKVCTTCDKTSIVWRKWEGGARLWCAACAAFKELSEVRDF
jgi:hypothetical protein